MSSEGRAGAISRFFIDRPVLANVLALVIVVIGLVALVAATLLRAHLDTLINEAGNRAEDILRPLGRR